MASASISANQSGSMSRDICTTVQAGRMSLKKLAVESMMFFIVFNPRDQGTRPDDVCEFRTNCPQCNESGRPLYAPHMQDFLLFPSVIRALVRLRCAVVVA